MNEYEIGRDTQLLRSRIQRLESRINGHVHNSRDLRGSMVRHEVTPGVARDDGPVRFKAERAMKFLPLLYRFLGLEGIRHQYDIMPESQTWTCTPEPLILMVNWYAGGSDEFYRLKDQTFSITRVTEPNTGKVYANATYYARLVASGKGSSHYVPATSSYSGSRATSAFRINLKDHGGGQLWTNTGHMYSIDCSENRDFIESFSFNAGLYDLVGGATWEIVGAQEIDRC